MIDVETKIFTPVAKVLRSKYDGIYVTGEYVRKPPKFPHVTLEETDNYPDPQTQYSHTKQDYAVIIYTANVYSNLTTGKKRQCREIMQTIDEQMRLLNFFQVYCSPADNQYDGEIYRMIAQWRAVTDGKYIFKRR